MSHTFKYPDTDAPTATLTFTRAWFEGDEAYYQRNQDVDFAAGGTMRAISHGAAQKVQPLTVRVPRFSAAGESHETDWVDTEAFIVNTVDFAVEEFWWTDDSGNKHRVRMENDSTKPDKSYVNYIDYTFQLRILETVAAT